MYSNIISYFFFTFYRKNVTTHLNITGEDYHDSIIEKLLFKKTFDFNITKQRGPDSEWVVEFYEIK